jgi:hypothetical protein
LVHNKRCFIATPFRALKYVIKKAQENRVGLKLNATYQLLVYADDVNLLRENIGTIKKNTETPTDVSKEIGLEVNVETTQYMLMSRKQNAGQNHDMKIGNRCFENVAHFRYSGMTVTKKKRFSLKPFIFPSAA